LIEIYGLILTDSFADAAFLLFQVKTALINIGNQGNGLGEVDMDGFILRYFLIKGIGVFDRAVFYAGGATRAFAFDNISGLFNQRDFEISCFSCYQANFSIGKNLYVRMPADLDQFG
jgi:hypothetical protein